QFDIDRVHAAQTAIKSRGFTRSSRAGYDEDAVGLIDRLCRVIKNVFGKAEGFEVEIYRRTIEHAQHDRLSELRRKRRDTEVDLLGAHLVIDSTVLGQSPLGNIQVRHDLQAGDHRQRQMLRRRRHFIKCSIHAISDLKFILERLEMDVARAVLHGLIEHKIYKTD